MHSRFHGQIGRGIALTVSVIALSGCVQATRHSNTMVFGTNTSVGVKVGTDVAQVPAIQIGYNRQEAVIMPLLANTGEYNARRANSSNRGNNSSNYNLLSPCVIGPIQNTVPQGSQSHPTGSQPSAGVDESMAESPHPCRFVATRTSGPHTSALDSYSVLASFGAEIEGSASDQAASVGLAQYFATGIAAQVLAATGGASVVAVGEAATASANNEARAQAAAAIVNEQITPAGAGLESLRVRADLSTLISETSLGADRKRKIEALYNALVPTMNPYTTRNTGSACEASIQACLEAVDKAASSLAERRASLDEQLEHWEDF